MRRDSRWWIVVSLLTLLVLALAACSPIADEAEDGTGAVEDSDDADSDSAPGDGDASQQGGTLTLLQADDIENFDPSIHGIGNRVMMPQIYDTLIQLDENFEPQPALAESWDESDDGRTFTFHLRDGVVFHDGSEFTADDVVFNFERYTDPDIGANISTLLTLVSSVTAEDEQTVTFELEDTTANFFHALDLMFITPQASDDDIKTKGVGTGPFKVEDYAPGDRVRFTRNEDYWAEDRPHLDEVVVRFMGDIQSALLNFEGGEGEVLAQPPYEAADRLAADTEAVTVAPGSRQHVIAFNTTVSPWDNKLVRQAFHYAIDRERAVSLAYRGLSEAWCLPWPEASPAFDPELARGCERDVQKAKDLLAEAGYEDGFETTLFLNSNQPGVPQTIEVFQQNLQEVGIRATIDRVEGAQIAERKVASDFDVYVGGVARGSRDPSVLLGATVVYAPDRTVTLLDSDQYQRLVSDIATTVDADERQRLFNELNEFLLDEAFILAVSDVPTWYAVRDTVQGFEANADGMPRFANARLSD